MKIIKTLIDGMINIHKDVKKNVDQIIDKMSDDILIEGMKEDYIFKGKFNGKLHFIKRDKS